METTKYISFTYRISNDEEIINDRIESLLNSNNLFSEQMKKMNIYRTEFYNIFFEPKTKWLIDNLHVRLYIREDFDKFSHYIPIGIVTKAHSSEYDDEDRISYYTKEHKGIINAEVYPEILEKYKDFYNKSGELNTDKYNIGYISCGDDIIAITLKHTGTKFESKDAYMIHCNKMIKFAKDYIKENNLH